MFNILLSMKKAAIYLVVLLLVFFPVLCVETPVKTYAAGVEEQEVQATEPAENAGYAAEAVTETAPAEAAEAPEEDLPDIDFLDIPEIQEARYDAQATLMAKREDMDRAWLELKAEEAAREKEKAERERAAAKEAAAAAAKKSESSGSSSEKSPARVETTEHGSGTDLGKFKLTAYCPCYQCSEGWGRMTSSGNLAQERHTIATDPSVIPEGTKVEINGVVYTAEDIGGGVRGNHIDIFYESHEECLQFGVRYAEVFKVN